MLGVEFKGFVAKWAYGTQRRPAQQVGCPIHFAVYTNIQVGSLYSKYLGAARSSCVKVTIYLNSDQALKLDTPAARMDEHT